MQYQPRLTRSPIESKSVNIRLVVNAEALDPKKCSWQREISNPLKLLDCLARFKSGDGRRRTLSWQRLKFSKQGDDASRRHSRLLRATILERSRFFSRDSLRGEATVNYHSRFGLSRHGLFILTDLTFPGNPRSIEYFQLRISGRIELSKYLRYYYSK